VRNLSGGSRSTRWPLRFVTNWLAKTFFESLDTQFPNHLLGHWAFHCAGVPLTVRGQRDMAQSKCSNGRDPSTRRGASCWLAAWARAGRATLTILTGSMTSTSSQVYSKVLGSCTPDQLQNRGRATCGKGLSTHECSGPAQTGSLGPV
jgi:hypothetical protein